MRAGSLHESPRRPCEERGERSRARFRPRQLLSFPSPPLFPLHECIGSKHHADTITPHRKQHRLRGCQERMRFNREIWNFAKPKVNACPPFTCPCSRGNVITGPRRPPRCQLLPSSLPAAGILASSGSSRPPAAGILGAAKHNRPSPQRISVWAVVQPPQQPPLSTLYFGRAVVPVRV